MIHREYHVPSPNVLEHILRFVNEGEIKSLKHLWESDIEAHIGQSRYNSSVYVRLVAESNSHRAYLIRKDKHGLDMVCANLSYNRALRYCMDNLTMTAFIRE